MRKALDRLYLGCGLAAAGCLLAMLGVVLTQMIARWTGQTFAGGTNYAGYLMATSSFLALAYALNHGAHIRVSLVLNRLGRHRRWGEAWCLAISCIVGAYMAWFATKTVLVSHQLGDVSQGMDETPMWLPQIPMAFGSIVLAIALVDNAWRVIALGRAPHYPAGTKVGDVGADS